MRESYIEIKLHDEVCRITLPHSEFGAAELKEYFSRLLVTMGFFPDVIDLAEGGKYKCEFIDEDEG